MLGVPIADRPPRAWFGGLLAEGHLTTSDDPADLDRGGWWAVVVTFEGDVRLHRFATVRRAGLPRARGSWCGPAAGAWTSSLDERAYRAGVEEIRRRVRDGEVYQVNLCRVLSAELPAAADPWALAARLAAGNPAPYTGALEGPDGRWVVSASPELFLRREGDVVTSSPIKGTAAPGAPMLPKDEAENIMITDLVRNDLHRVCRPGTVEVTALLAREEHPGLAHLVSTVRGRLAPGAGWADLLAAAAPAGSVSGAPKSSALRAVRDLEPVPRGPYCGAIGWVDADRGTGCLAVGIRTFWADGGRLHYGTGAGITWGSDPAGEWEETRLKAGRLVALATGPPDQRAGRAPDGGTRERYGTRGTGMSGHGMSGHGMSGTTVWLDGKVLPGEEARVSAVDHGITVGDGIFETCKVVDGVPFALGRHLRRLARSAAVLALPLPPEREIEDAVAELLAATAPAALGRLRVTVTGGPGPLSSDRGPAGPTLVLALAPAAPWPARIAAVTVGWPRNERSPLAGAKTTSYAENVVTLRLAHERGAHEALLPNTRGELCEGTGSNVVVERDGVLVTPPLTSGCLAGITRELLLEWAHEEGLPVVEDVVPMAELATAPEVLLTSSTRDVQHVSELDGRVIPGTALGRAASELFARRAAAAVNP